MIIDHVWLTFNLVTICLFYLIQWWIRSSKVEILRITVKLYDTIILTKSHYKYTNSNQALISLKNWKDTQKLFAFYANIHDAFFSSIILRFIDHKNYICKLLWHVMNNYNLTASLIHIIFVFLIL